MIKPKCKLVGVNGNIYNLLGIARSCLKKNGLKDEADKMTDELLDAHSYDEALAVIMKYVDVE